MMGSASPLPLSASLAPATPVGAQASAAPVAASVAATGPQPESMQATDGEVDPALLFGLLLGAPADAAETTALPLATANAGKSKPVSTAIESAADVVDPLAMILAQMPQLQPVQQAPVVAAAVPTPITTATTDAAPAQALQQALAVAAASPTAGQPIAGSGDAQPAAAGPALSSHASATNPEAAAATRFVLPQADAPKQAAITAPTLAFAAEVLPAHAQNEPAASPLIASLQALPAHPGLQATAAAAPPSSPSVLQHPVLQQPADPAAGYDDRFGSHIALLAGQRISQAEIRVVPEHLGAIDIRLHLDGSDVRAEFHSAQPEVRQALEASLPRLREMLGQHGLQLSHAGVGHGQTGQGQGKQGETGATRAGDATAAAGGDEPGTLLPPDSRRARGLLDVYA